MATDNIIGQSVQKYMERTMVLNDYNEIYNLNNYFNSSLSFEDKKLTDMNNTLQSKMMQMKHEQFEYDYKTARTTMKNNILYMSMIFISISFIVLAFFNQNKLSQKLTIFILIVVFFVYLFVILTIYYQNIDRRKQDWNQFYFSNIPKK